MMLTIVTYHYVRDLPRTRFPEIRGLATGRFEGQLDYLTEHYTFCHPDEVLAAVRGETVLPPNGCLLTFDDGLSDHYTTVFPRLEERGIPAVFFPAARPIPERTMLEVHMIHFVLASVPDWVELPGRIPPDRKSTRLNSSHTVISYAVFCLKKKKQ